MDNIAGKKIIFFGTPNFTVEFLELFKSLGIEIVAVITGEDRPVGRGMQMQTPGPKVWAGVRSVIFQPKKLDEEFYLTLKNIVEKEKIDLFIVIAYGKIIPEKIINLPKHGTINLHYSLLPKYRGASPVESAILNNEIETGITIQQMVYKLDAGKILFQEKMHINETETASELRERMNKRASEIFPEFLNKYLNPSKFPQMEGVAQDEQQATSCGKFTKEDFDVTKDLENKNLKLIYKKYRAFNKKIYFFFGDKKLRVKITEMNKSEILKVLPESKKEIFLKDFENSFGKFI